MTTSLKDFAVFESERLFQGAINLDWFWTDPKRSRMAAESFVFHGPQYHGVTQADIGVGHGHALQDTATFTRSIVRRCFGLEDQPFTLAIAGYGTGKSHIALALASLLSNPKSKTSEKILSHLEDSDNVIGKEIGAIFNEQAAHSLVITINGMGNFDLTAEITQQIIRQVKDRELDTTILDELRPRFRQASNLVNLSNEDVVSELIEFSNLDTKEDLLSGLENQDENIYARVHDFFDSRGMPIRSFGGESIKDVIAVATNEYCGVGKPFSRLIVIFDEFGKYTEFATERSQIAGNGVLQDLFEAIQEHSDVSCFVGFIQFELNAYVQRVAPEFRNDILRYITRYQSANKAYLSVNLETLIANLITKKNPLKLNSWFDSDAAKKESNGILGNINDWFPQSLSFRLWSSVEQFHSVIRKGCWPLSPYTTWLLYYLAAAGKHLQERSALALLGDAFKRYGETEISDDSNWLMHPVDLWTDALEQELITSEELGQQGAIALSYTSVMARHGAMLGNDLKKILKSVVLASKMGLVVDSRDDAIVALSCLAGLPSFEADRLIDQLQEEYNVLEWDDNFKSFDIVGDTVPKTQFLGFLRQRVASSYDEDGKAQLFASKASEWCDLLDDIECDFAENHDIFTREWSYQAATTDFGNLVTHLQIAAKDWKAALGVDVPRGKIIYCYVGQNTDPDKSALDVKTLIRNIAKDVGTKSFPLLIVFLYDSEGELGKALAELAVLNEGLSDSERAQFGNLIDAHKEKLQGSLRTSIEDMIRERRYVTSFGDELRPSRLSRVGTELFDLIYSKPLSFPFDGFSTARGNGADTWSQLVTELLGSNLDYQRIMSYPVKQKNRATKVLKENWDVFSKDGRVSRRPRHAVVKSILERWDRNLKSSDHRFFVGKMLREVCLPPHGANIASAGLLMGLFVSSRSSDMVVIKSNRQIAVSQWVQEGIFRGKQLDIASLDNIELALLGEGASEWENLLDEWEQCESHSDKVQLVLRADELKSRNPIPPNLAYKYEFLDSEAKSSREAINDMKRNKGAAIDRIYSGEENKNVGDISRGGAELLKLKTKMTSEKPNWTQQEIDALDNDIERAIQYVNMYFPEWIIRQTPRNDSPEVIGSFKHRMINLIGRNFNDLGLVDLYNSINERTNAMIKDATTAAEASKLVRDVNAWIQQHSAVFRILRLAQIRGLRQVGKEFSAKLRGMTQRIESLELLESRNKLSKFMDDLKQAEDKIGKRSSEFWKSTTLSLDMIDSMVDEVVDLIGIYEGIDNDLQDFRLCRNVLQLFQADNNQLSNEQLTWKEFDDLGKTLMKEAMTKFEEEEPPWGIEETYKGLIEEITKSRMRMSNQWIEGIKVEIIKVEDIDATEADLLLRRANQPPPFLSSSDLTSLEKEKKKIIDRLEDLNLDWLIGRFRQLSDTAKQRFLDEISL